MAINKDFFQNAVSVSIPSNTVIKNKIELTLNKDGSLTQNGNVIGRLKLGHKGDNCVTAIVCSIPSEFILTNYSVYLVVDTASNIYIQKCGKTGQDAIAWIDSSLTLNFTSLTMLFAIVETETADNKGSVPSQTEQFVSEQFYGDVITNFLTGIVSVEASS